MRQLLDPKVDRPIRTKTITSGSDQLLIRPTFSRANVALSTMLGFLTP